MESCQVLVVGAGGLGCELLKNLALLGFRNIHVIDMDTIDLSNLNRQFLFRLADVGQSKAVTAANFINKRVEGANVVAHHNKIEDKDEEFYRQFHVVVCGLDSIIARRWLNRMIMSLVEYDQGPDGTAVPKLETLIPIVDGGTEGFKGNARVIIPTQAACVECSLDLFPPQVDFPLCTIAQTPRLPEHCIEYVRVLQWPKEKPFEAPIDGDDPDHINWIYERAVKRANEFNITGVTYRLTQGVIKHIIPAVASTNAVIAAVCSTEVFKLATRCSKMLNNYMLFSDIEGIYTYTYAPERKEDCNACTYQQTFRLPPFDPDVTLEGVIEYLKENPTYQMKSPGIQAVVEGKTKTLYMKIMAQTETNLKLKMKQDLGVIDGIELLVADQTLPNPLSFSIHYNPPVPT
jgi:ubiquitin-activating enzyme E1 C